MLKISLDKAQYCYTSGNQLYCALNSTSLDFGLGLTALIGKSGSGKTTLLSMLCGILPPTNGDVIIENTNLYSMSDDELARYRNVHFGIVPQRHSTIPCLSLYESVTLPLFISESGDKKLDYADRLLSTLGLDSIKNRLVRNLSGGELRKMSIARALVNSPDYIFADEPTNDLDRESTTHVLQMLRYQADNQKVVIVVTHDKAVLEFADNILYVEDGVVKKEE